MDRKNGEGDTQEEKMIITRGGVEWGMKKRRDELDYETGRERETKNERKREEWERRESGKLEGKEYKC